MQAPFDQILHIANGAIQLPQAFAYGRQSVAHFHDTARLPLKAFPDGFLQILASSTALFAAALDGKVPNNRKPVPASLGCVPSKAIHRLPVLTIWPK
jgi:hypothetical protein